MRVIIPYKSELRYVIDATKYMDNYIFSVVEVYNKPMISKKSLLRIESIATLLSEKIKSNDTESLDIDKFQSELNEVFSQISEDEIVDNSKIYIIYETQALIHWVEGDVKNARSLIKSTIKAKKDANIFTEFGRQIALSLKKKKLIIIAVVSIFTVLCTIFILSNTIVELNNSLNDMKSKKSKIELDLGSLRMQLYELNNQNEYLNTTVDKLKDEISSLELDSDIESDTYEKPSVASVCGTLEPFSSRANDPTAFDQRFNKYNECFKDYYNL